MSIASNFPAIKPTLLLDFANTEELDPRITFTRASTATYYGTQTAKAEENLLLQSQTFTPNWSVGNVTLAGNATTAPDGTTTAATLTGTSSTNNAKYISQVVAMNGTYTVSVYLKNTSQQFMQLLTNGDTNPVANFDLTNGTFTIPSGTATASITSVGSSWYRCTLTFTTSTATGVYFWFIDTSGAARGPASTSVGTVQLWGAQLEQRSAVTAYTPTTTQPITNYIPQLLTAASGVARFDHNPTTFESLGLEIEEQRTNLLTYSEDFSNAVWNTNSTATRTSNTAVSPDGSITADTIANVSGSQLGVTVTGVIGTAYTYSIWVRRLTGTGAVQLIDVNGNATTIDVTAQWQRFSITATATSTTARAYLRILTTNDSIAAWGAQLEIGAFATSYIPTVASQVTRANDFASMTGTNFSSWYNQGAGTLYGEYVGVDNVSGGTRRLAEIGSSTESSNRMIAGYGSTTLTRWLVVSGGATQADITPSATQGVLVKSANAYAANDFQSAANTTLGTADTAGTVPVVSALFIGTDNAATANTALNGTIRKIAYYPVRVTNAQLQGLTS